MFFVPGCQVEGARVQCGVPEVGLIDRIGHKALVPVLVSVAEPWGVVEGCRLPAHLEPRGSRESGSTHLQPPIHVGMSLMRL